MSEAQEIQLGQQMDAQVREEMGIYDDAELQRYVQDVGMRLARSIRSPESAVALRRRRFARGERVRLARRISISPAASCRFWIMKRSSRGAPVTRSATSPRGTRRSST